MKKYLSNYKLKINNIFNGIEIKSAANNSIHLVLIKEQISENLRLLTSRILMYLLNKLILI